MNHLGDITNINGAQTEPVDCITFGSPCQDLSVAGPRKGMLHADKGDEETTRSGLFMEAVRIIKEMRLQTNGSHPTFAVWENVAGALSSQKGEDFRTVLEELARIADKTADVPIAPKGKWANSGCILGDEWSIAWRISDAKFWGVPQRRRRIAVVVDFAGHRAPEILFERKGVRGDFETGRWTWQAAAGDFAPCAGVPEGEYCGGVGDGGADVCRGAAWSVTAQPKTLKIRSGCEGGGKGALVQEDLSATLGTSNDQYLFCIAGNMADRHCVCSYQDVTGTLCANSHTGSYTGQDAQNDMLAAGKLCAAFNGHKSVSGSIQYAQECAPTLEANMPSDVMCDAFSAGQGEKAGGIGWAEECAPTLKGCASGTNSVPCACIDCRNMKVHEESGPLQAKPNGGQSLNFINPVMQFVNFILWIVRRLTPTECERLNGYPDGWTDIGPWVDENGKLHKESSDSARYKAMGNSIALPFWHWMLGRMKAYLPENATLGSLFDGVGGFPLVWERLHGKGTARWASEIEQFPIAVTKYHFRG